MEASVEKLRQLAEEAQADLKMDYAWLEDVTYEDWEQYNHLMKSKSHVDCRFFSDDVQPMRRSLSLRKQSRTALQDSPLRHLTLSTTCWVPSTMSSKT